MPPQGAPETGPPPPPMGETAVRGADDRPASVGPKRMREWEDEPSVKKQANDENRARLDEMRPRRPSTPPRDAYRRNSSESRRVEDQRRAEEPRRPDEPRHPNDAYHPSEAAHHTQTHSVGAPSHLPPIQQGLSPMQGVVHEKTPVATPKEERPPPIAAPPVAEPERAARKMDVDEDYDDSGEDEKKTGALANGSGPGSASGEVKTSTPSSAGVNGATAAAATVE